MDTTQFTVEEIKNKIEQWFNENPDCLWLQQALHQLQQSEEVHQKAEEFLIY